MKQYSAGFSLRRNQWNVFCWHRLLSSENWVKWYYISEIVFFFRLFHLILSRQCWDRFILVFVILFLQIIPLNLDLKVLKQIYPYSLVWRMSRDGKLHGSDMSHATTASPKPSLRVPWRVGDAMVGRGNAGWTTWESGHFCPCQNCSQGPPYRKDWKRISAESPLMSPWRCKRSRDWKWTELCQMNGHCKRLRFLLVCPLWSVWRQTNAIKTLGQLFSSPLPPPSPPQNVLE